MSARTPPPIGAGTPAGSGERWTRLSRDTAPERPSPETPEAPAARGGFADEVPAGRPPATAGRRPPRGHPGRGAADLGATAIEGSQSIGDAALAILRRYFQDFLPHEEGTREGSDPEELHQMRVAARRLRTALALFRDVLPPRADRIRRELAWLGPILGHVRDADVQIQQAAAWQAEAGRRDRATFQPLLDLLQGQRTAARVPLLRALDSPRYRRFRAVTTVFLRQGSARRTGAARLPVLAAAPDLVGRRFRAMRKTGDRLRGSSPAAKFHELRIKAKRLRYPVEFFADLYGKPARTYARRVAALQDVLGQQQDAIVAGARLRRLCEAHGRRLPPRTTFALGRAAERYDRQAREAREAFPEAYREVTGKRWKRLRDTMEAQRPDVPPGRG